MLSPASTGGNTTMIKDGKYYNFSPEWNAKKWQKGQSGNPSGRPSWLLTRDKVKSIVDRLFSLSPDEIRAIMTSPKSTVIEMTVASILIKAIETGDFSRFDGLLNRAVGRVIDEIKVSPGGDIVQDAIRAIPVERLGEVIESLQVTKEVAPSETDCTD